MGRSERKPWTHSLILMQGAVASLLRLAICHAPDPSAPVISSHRMPLARLPPALTLPLPPGT